MPRELFAPYILIAEEQIGLGKWEAKIGDDQLPLQEVLAQWTTGTNLTIQRSVEASQQTVRGLMALDSKASFGISVTFFNNDSKLREQRYLEPLDEDSSKIISTEISGDLLGGRSELVTSLVLLNAGDAGKVGVARRKGSILTKDVEPIEIGVDESGFPTAIVRFATLPYHSLASWHLETSTDLDAPFTSVFQLLINEDDKSLVKAIESERPNREQQSFLDQMTSGVIEIMLELAFSQWNALMEDDRAFEEGSVGEALRHVLEVAQVTGPMTFEGPDNASRRRSYYSGLARQINAGRLF